eukprot:Phypoly_transcript_08497.p1 GENE.Phypoly_transcript_08497~~Phypoly_transcript_08497.p1  ORF type:complete len:445 (+),score=69.11 Phypoly_transcript_08497:152-1486(+)
MATAQPQTDALQLLLQRKSELAKNKAKFNLTEADATLITLRSTDVVFLDGEKIHEEGTKMSCVYRIKSGKVTFSRRGHKIQDIGQGWFIGDSLLLSNKSSVIMPTTLTANGMTFLVKLDLAYVRNLFKVDSALSMKFYRYLATKFAASFFQMFASFDHPALNPSSDPDVLSEPYEAKGLSYIDERVWDKDKSESVLYKTYQLTGTKNGVRTLKIKSNKIKITTNAFGATKKKRILIAEIINITKLGHDKVSITHRKKHVKIHFKNPGDTEEFVGIASGLVPNFAHFSIKPEADLDGPQDDYEEFKIKKVDQALYSTIRVEEHYKKGDKVFEEGDLMQRVYTFTSGIVNVLKDGVLLGHVEAGDIIGVGTLLILRPSVVTLEVASETATALVVPGYKIWGLMETHPSLANRIFKDAAQILERQTTEVLQDLDGRTKRGRANAVFS